MILEFSLATAFFTGMLGSAHCVGMCGGIVGALTLGIDPARRATPLGLMPYLSAYNVGRLISYTIAGAIAGLAGQLLLGAALPAHASTVGRVIAGMFMVMLGLYFSGWWLGLGALEKAGAHLWRRVEPLGRRLLPVRTPGQALLIGLLWGWLPCGMVYAALAWALAAGSALNGALVMLAFGAGTLPMLLAMGTAGAWLTGVTRRPAIRRTIGLVAILFGLYTLFFATDHHADHQHGNSHLQLHRDPY
jgi:sulfite exporter TauE/SafE